MFFCVVLNGSANIADWTTGFDGLDAEPGAFFSHSNEITTRLVNLTNTEGCIGVAVHAANKPGHIKVHDVPVEHDSRVRNAVTNHFVRG